MMEETLAQCMKQEFDLVSIDHCANAQEFPADRRAGFCNNGIQPIGRSFRKDRTMELPAHVDIAYSTIFNFVGFDLIHSSPSFCRDLHYFHASMLSGVFFARNQGKVAEGFTYARAPD